jgi:hypothetical protein
MSEKLKKVIRMQQKDKFYKPPKVALDVHRVSKRLVEYREKSKQVVDNNT